MDEFTNTKNHTKKEFPRKEENRLVTPREDTFFVPEKESPQMSEKSWKEEEDKRGNLHTFLRRYAFIAMAVFFAVMLIFLLCPVPFGHLVISGAKNVTTEDILFEGQINTPINTLQISTADLEERLKHDIRIDEVKVERHFLGTIEVHVTERKAVAAMQGEFTYVFLDKNGVVIQSEVALTSANVPMITGKKLGNALLGDCVTDEDVLKALSFLRSLTEAGENLFSEINIGNPEQIKAYTRDGISVHLGEGPNLEEQASLAEHMVNDVKSRKLSVEYLEANTVSPYIKLKK